jgi:hypothetical protein
MYRSPECVNGGWNAGAAGWRAGILPDMCQR